MDDFARFFDNSLDLNGIASAEGYFRRVNIAWERTLGWTADEVAASPWLEFVHPEDRQSTIDAGQRLFAGASIISFENRYRCKDGSYRLIQWHAETVGSEAYCSGRDVTDERARLVLRANIERVDELREHGPWFFAIFDNAPFAMALTTTRGGVTVGVNEAFLRVFEFARDEVLGRTSISLGISDADSHARLAAELRDRGAVRDFECVRRTKTGARVVLLLNVEPVDVNGEAYVLTSARDVTRASAAAAELRALVDNLPELAWTARPDGFIEFYNRRWYDYTGTCYEDMQGWGWQSVHDPAELPRVMESWTDSIATRRPFDQTFPLRRKDGVFRWFLTRVAPILDDAGELIRWVGINTDIDDQRRAQKEREDLLGQLRTLNAGLEERVRDRTSELSATLKEREVLLQEIHHRVKNNLQVISSLINMQVRQLKDTSSRDALQECQTRVQAIALIHEKLYQSKDYARVQFSEYAKSLAENVFTAVGVAANTVVLDLQIGDVALAVDKAIPCGLILNELITNALKHAFPTVRRGTVRVELRQVGAGEIVLSVSDDGIGISTDFDPAKSKSLGVQLVLTLVEQLDGQLEIVRKEGTTFRVTFPLEPAP